MRKYESAGVRRCGSALAGLIAVAAACALPSRGVAQLPLQPLALEHGTAGEGVARGVDVETRR